MPFNIETFKSSLEQDGYLKTSNYQVIIAPPPVMRNDAVNGQSVNGIASNMTFKIDSVRSPSVSLNSTDIARYGIGVTQKQVFGAQMGEISFSVISDKYGDIWSFWHEWIRSIFDFTGDAYGTGISTNRIATYVSEYKDNYATTMQIIVFDPFGNIAQTIDIYDAFPTNMREINLSWDTDELIRLNISMAFKEYTIRGSSITPLSIAEQLVEDVIQSII